MIRKEGSRWILYTRDGNRVLGRHRTKKEAEAQELEKKLRGRK
jgi:hypothetical protein